MAENRVERLTAVAALAEPTRRRLYDHVVRSPEPVGRDEAAAALGVPRATAAFHLDRLASDGLLDVVRRRRTGRSGPGAGRPAKLYRRAEGSIAVSLPERRYDLAGELLAAAVEESDRTGARAGEVLDRRAHGCGEEIGRAARERAADAAGAVGAVLEEHGFEPRADGASVVLANCPFSALAARHPALVCGMNLSLLAGVLSGAGETDVRARIDPGESRCCVRLEPEPPTR